MSDCKSGEHGPWKHSGAVLFCEKCRKTPVTLLREAEATIASVVLQVGEPEPGQDLGNLVRGWLLLTAKNAAEDERAKAEATIERLRVGLAFYGNHKPTCARVTAIHEPCGCGLDALLKELKEGSDE